MSVQEPLVKRQTAMLNPLSELQHVLQPQDSATSNGTTYAP